MGYVGQQGLVNFMFQGMGMLGIALSLWFLPDVDWLHGLLSVG